MKRLSDTAFGIAHVVTDDSNHIQSRVLVECR